MAQIILGAKTVLNLSTDLDPMFTELYNNFATGNFTAATTFTYGNGTGAKSLTINGGTASGQGGAVTFQRAGTAVGAVGDAAVVLGGTATGTAVNAVGNTPITLRTNSVDRVYVDGLGNSSFGKTASTRTSGDSGVIVYGTVSANYGRIDLVKGSESGAGGTFAMMFNYSTTMVGNVICTSTSTAFNTSSDARLKTEVEDMEDVGEIVDSMRPRVFEFKAEPNIKRMGFIAQELRSVFPDAVHEGSNSEEIENPEDTWSVDFSKLVPLLVKEIQTLRSRVAALEGDE